MKEMIALATKDLRLLARDKGGFFFTFGFPVLTAIFFGYIFSGQGGGGDTDGGPPKLKLAFVDQDQTDGSREFAEALRKGGELELIEATAEEAEGRVRRGEIPAMLVLPKGFGESRENMFAGNPAKMELAVDPSHRAESGMLQGILLKHGFSAFQDLIAKPEKMQAQARKSLEEFTKAEGVDQATRDTMLPFLNSWVDFSSKLAGAMNAAPAGDAEKEGDGSTSGAASWTPVAIETRSITKDASPQVKDGPTNSFQISFPQGMMWGVVGCVASFAVSLVVERTEGTLIRLQVSPVGRRRIMGGKALACFASTLIVIVTLSVLGAVAFGVHISNIPLYALTVICVAFGFTGVMVLLSTIGRTERATAGAGWAIMLIFSMIGGGAVPLFVMPPFMRTISGFSPIKWSILALEGVIWRDFRFVEMLPPLAALVALGAGTFALGSWRFRWND